jgi:phosphoenolpyruvate synthase/pyruvate phosphate dikinase
MHIEQHFGAPQDIELVFANGEIVVTQTRPITASK